MQPHRSTWGRARRHAKVSMLPLPWTSEELQQVTRAKACGAAPLLSTTGAEVTRTLRSTRSALRARHASFSFPALASPRAPRRSNNTSPHRVGPPPGDCADCSADHCTHPFPTPHVQVSLSDRTASVLSFHVFVTCVTSHMGTCNPHTHALTHTQNE